MSKLINLHDLNDKQIKITILASQKWKAHHNTSSKHMNTHETQTKEQNKTKVHWIQVCVASTCLTTKADPTYKNTKPTYIIGKPSATDVTDPKNS